MKNHLLTSKLKNRINRRVNYMNRLTRALDSNDFYIVDDTKIKHDINGYSGDAVNKLAKFENFYDDLMSRQNEISKELEKLRLEDKTRTVRFKQLLADKLTNNNIIMLFKTYGL